MTDIGQHIHTPPPRDDGDVATAALIAHLVAFSAGVSPRELASSTRRSAPAARARQVAMYLAHTALSWPLGRVGAAFGRDRTTAAHACARVEDLRDDAGFDSRLTELEACLHAAPPHRGLAAPGAQEPNTGDPNTGDPNTGDPNTGGAA